MERRERFAREQAARHRSQVAAVGRPPDAIDSAAVLVVATNTGGAGPALLGEWLPAGGLHVSSIGSTLPTQRELDPAVWAWADRIVLDTRRALDESGDGIAARQAGTLDEGKVAELHEVIAGTAPGRRHPDERTLYKSVGSGLQDLAVAWRAYELAVARGIGRRADDHLSVKRTALDG